MGNRRSAMKRPRAAPTSGQRRRPRKVRPRQPLLRPRPAVEPELREPTPVPVSPPLFDSLVAAGYTCVLALVYLPTLTTTYGRVDDYAYLWSSLDGTLASGLAVQVPQGRPLYDLYVQLTFGNVHSVAGLVGIRLVCLLSLVALAFFLSRHLRALGAPLVAALLVPLVVALMPPFALYQAWASASPYAVAGLVAGAGSLLVDRALAARRHRWPYLAAAAGCVLVAAAFYQPSAMMLWLFAAARFVLVPATPKARWLEVGAKVAVSAIGLLLDFVASLVLPYLIYGHQVASSRSSVATNVGAKISDFGQALYDALNMSKLLPSVPVAVVVGLVIAGGIMLRSRWTPRWPAVFASEMAVAVVVVVMAYAPSLVTALNWPAYRTQGPLTAAVALYATFAVVSLVEAWRWRHSLTALAAPLALVLLAAGLFANRDISTDISGPEARQWDFVNARVQQAARTPGVKTIDVVEVSSFGFAPLVRYDEFGYPTSDVSVAEEAMVSAALAQAPQRFRDHVTVTVSQSPSTSPGTFVVDDVGLATYRPS